MKILLLAYVYSVYTKEFIEHVLNDSKYSITILDDGTAPKEYYDFYESRGVELLNVPFKTRIVGKIPKLRVLWYEYRVRSELRRKGPYDFVHIHFVAPEKFRYIPHEKEGATRVLASFWGSDIYRVSETELQKLKRRLDKCEAITIVGDKMYQALYRIFGNRYDHLVRKVFFGISTFDVIDKVKTIKSYKDCKADFGIGSDQTVIAIGYNRSEGQQHSRVLEALVDLPINIQKKITIILQMTYGFCTDAYAQKIKEIVAELACKTIVLENYLAKETVASLRIATDIYINAQITDAFSASVQEYLYAGAELVNPTWIQYPELDSWGIPYHSYTEFEALPMIIRDIVTSKDKNHGEFARVLKAKTSWDAVRSIWMNLYEE